MVVSKSRFGSLLCGRGCTFASFVLPTGTFHRLRARCLSMQRLVNFQVHIFGNFQAVCPPSAASSHASGVKVSCALALRSACPLTVSARLFATAVAVAKASRHRGCATVTWCVRRVSCMGSGEHSACGPARALRQAFACSGPLHEQEFMQTEHGTRLSAGIVSRPWKLDKIRLQSLAFAQRAPAQAVERAEGANEARLPDQGVGCARHRGICAQA
jgi:hypothetical protein